MTSSNSLDRKSQAWSALFSEPMSELVQRYTASVFFDQRLWRADIQGSLAHAEMLQAQAIIELGCGNARLSCGLVQRFGQCTVTGLEVDAVQHAKNLTRAPAGVTFVAAGAQDVPFGDASFDLALMLKSLHHVPLDLLDQALSEVARVLRPGSLFYVSEPIYGGALNEIVRIYNDEGVVRPAAQAALDLSLIHI